MTRVRLRKVKAARWAKGSACASNPRSRVFREASLKRKEREKQQEALYEESSVLPFSDTLSNRSFAFSGLTECSVVTFRRIFEKFSNPDEFNKEVCVVFNSISNMIQEQTDNPQDCDFFCCLLASLNPQEENVTLVSSMVYLISLVVLKVSPSLVARCSLMGLDKFSQILFSVTSKLDGRNIVCLCKCICAFLSYSDPTIWSTLTANVDEVFTKVLTFVSYGCPKVSHGVAKHITRLLMSENRAKFIPLSSKFFNIFFETATSYQNMNAKFIIVFDMLNFLRKVLHLFEERYLKVILNSILKFSLVCSKNIKHEIFKTLSAFFSNLPDERILSIDVDRKLLMAFEDMLPKTSSACNQSTLEILRTMANCAKTISKLNPEHGCNSLLQFCSSVLPYSVSEKFDLKKNAYCLIEDVAIFVLSEENLKLCYTNESYAKNIKNLCSLLRANLNIEHMDSFVELFRLLRSLFECIGLFYPDYVKEFVYPLFQLYENPCVEKVKMVGNLLCLVIKKIGPELYLSCFDDRTFLTVPWILSLMKDSLMNNVTLGFYNYKLEPLVHDTIVSEDIRDIIYQLLPEFCKYAVDLDELASFLDAAIHRLRTYCGDKRLLLALKNLTLNKNIPVGSLNFCEAARVVSQIYLDMRSRDGLGTPELDYLANMVVVFRNLAGHLDRNTLQLIFSHSVETLYSCKLEMVPVVLDILRILVDKVDTSQCEQFFCSFIVAFHDSYLPKMNRPSTNVIQQAITKKFLRLVLSAMVHHNLGFIFTNGEVRFVEMLKRLTSVPLDPSTKTVLMRTISQCAIELSSAGLNVKEFVTSFLPWAIICCGDSDQAQLKSSAADTVNNFCDSLGCEQNKHASFVNIFLESLELSNHAIVASLCALNSFVNRYRMEISQDTFNEVLTRVLFILKKQEDRSIVRACYNYIKICVKCLEQETLKCEAPKILFRLFMAEKMNNHSCRDDAFIIISKFIKKLGPSFVLASTPKMAKIFVRNISKRIRRSRKKKKLGIKNRPSSPDLRLYEGVEPVDLTSEAIPIVRVDNEAPAEPEATQDETVSVESDDDMKPDNLFNRRKPSQRANNKHKEFGAEYKAKRAKGDIKIKGRPAPYAYIPLSDKRRCGKAQRSTNPFKGLVGKKKKSN